MADSARVYLQLSRTGNQPIDGGSVVAGLKGWIEIEDWNWSMRHSTATSGGAQTVEPSILSFSKLMDSATPAMLEAMAKGELLTAKLRMDDASLELLDLTLTLQKVRIISYEMKVDSGDKLATIGEDWEFDYETVRFDYKANRKAGTATAELSRPPGASVSSPDSKQDKFYELAKDMKVEDLDKLWAKVRQKVVDDAAKPREPAKPGTNE